MSRRRGSGEAVEPTEQEVPKLIAATYPVLDVLWRMFIFIACMIWFSLHLQATRHRRWSEDALDHLRDRLAVPRFLHLPDHAERRHNRRDEQRWKRSAQSSTSWSAFQATGPAARSHQPKRALLDARTIRIIDIAFVGKDGEGSALAMELTELNLDVREGLEKTGRDLTDAAQGLHPRRRRPWALRPLPGTVNTEEEFEAKRQILRS